MGPARRGGGGTRRNRAGEWWQGADGVGEGRRQCGPPAPPLSIPWTTTEREMRHNLPRASICPRDPPATALRRPVRQQELGVREERNEDEGEEMGAGRGASSTRFLVHQGEQVERGGASIGGMATAWRQWPWSALWRREEKARFVKTSLEILNKLQTSPTAGFNHLNKAPGPFYKIWKNSYRLQMTFRCSTVFGLTE